MELFENIRLKVGYKILSGKISRIKRKVFYSNISQIKSIGIVWDSSNTDQFPFISKFFQKMHENKIDLKVIGYFPGKILPDQFTAVRYMTCFRKDDINLFYIPVTAEAINFINYKFDVLIDINFRKVFPLHYISSLSMAGFKVGLYDPEDENSPFELMMDIKGPVDIDNYLNNIMNYLEMINSEVKIKKKKKENL